MNQKMNSPANYEKFPNGFFFCLLTPRISLLKQKRMVLPIPGEIRASKNPGVALENASTGMRCLIE